MPVLLVRPIGGGHARLAHDSVEQILNKLRQRDGEPVTEVHIVNGLHPGLPFSYYTDLLSGLKKVRPGIHLKCFTAVEIAFFAESTA